MKYTNTNPDPKDTAAAIMSPITQALNNNNITLERLAGKLSDLIDCKRGEDPDNTTQLKAVETGLKLNQAYPNEKIDLNAQGTLTVEVVKFGDNSTPEDAPE